MKAIWEGRFGGLEVLAGALWLSGSTITRKWNTTRARMYRGLTTGRPRGAS